MQIIYFQLRSEKEKSAEELRLRSKREEFVKLSSYVLDKIFLSNLCCNGIRMVVDILRFDIRVEECIVHKIHRRIRACSGIRSVARIK